MGKAIANENNRASMRKCAFCQHTLFGSHMYLHFGAATRFHKTEDKYERHLMDYPTEIY